MFVLHARCWRHALPALQVRVAGPPNFTPVLTESEFLIDQLLANGLVDDEAILAIQRQFNHLTRRVTFEPDEQKILVRVLDV